jgi:hypothetical protein
MGGFGSSFPCNAALVLALSVGGGVIAVGCGDNKPDPKSQKDGQQDEMKGEGGQQADSKLPPLEEVEPADEDVEVPPAP